MKRMLKPLTASLAVVLASCAGAPPPDQSRFLVPAEGVKDVVSGTPLERFFPLVDGMVYTYKTVNEVGEEGILVARVHRNDAKSGELRFPRGAKTFTYAADGVMVKDRGADVYVLKAPLAEGTTWRGEHGGNTRVLKVGVAADTAAGHYEGCVQTMEERLGDAPVRYATVFCPDVGVVSIEAATGANYERASLKTYAPPMRMKADGSERTNVGGVDDPLGR